MDDNLAGKNAAVGATNADFVRDDGSGNRLPALQQMAIRAFNKMNFQEDQNMLKAKLLEELDVVAEIHESQQRSIVQLQMNYEALDSKYQNKKRNWREKFFNFGRAVVQNVQALRSRGLRARAEVRGDSAHGARVRQRQEQLEAAAAALCSKLEEAERASPRRIQQLQDKTLSEKQIYEQLREVMASHDEHSDVGVAVKKEKAQALERELTISTNAIEEASSTLALLQKDDQELDGSLAQFRNYLKMWQDKYSKDMADIDSKLTEENKIATELDVETDSLKRAVCNQTNFKRSLMEESAQLQERISALLSAKAEVAARKQELLPEIENAEAGISNMKGRIAERTQQLQETELRVQEMNASVATNKKEVQNLNDDLQQMILNSDVQQKTIDEERAKIVKEMEAYSTTEKSLEETERALAHVKDRICQMKREVTVKLSLHEETVSKLANEIEQKDSELASAVGSVEALKSELSGATAAQADMLASNEELHKESKATQAELVAVRLQLSLAEDEHDTIRAESAEIMQELIAAKKKAEELNKKVAAKVSAIAEHDEKVAAEKAALLELMIQASGREDAAAAALAALEAELAAQLRAEEHRGKLRKETAKRTSALRKEVSLLEKKVEAAADTVDSLKKDKERAVALLDKSKHENAKRVEEFQTLEKKLALRQQEQRKRAEASEIERRAKEVRLDLPEPQKRTAEAAKAEATPPGALKWPSLHRQQAAAANKTVQFRNTPPKVTVFDRFDSSDSGEDRPWSHAAKKQKYNFGARVYRDARAHSPRRPAKVAAAAAQAPPARQDSVATTMMPAPPPPAPAHRTHSQLSEEADGDAVSERMRMLSARPPRRKPRPYAPSLKLLKPAAESRPATSLSQPYPITKENEPTRDTAQINIEN